MVGAGAIFLLAVHPRVCGEHWDLSGWVLHWCGSSPRVRGTRREYPRDGRADRFIPACAGNTLATVSYDFPEPVHPRVCGEHKTLTVGCHQQRGSSPRVRGTLDLGRAP